MVKNIGQHSLKVTLGVAALLSLFSASAMATGSSGGSCGGHGGSGGGGGIVGGGSGCGVLEIQSPRARTPQTGTAVGFDSDNSVMRTTYGFNSAPFTNTVGGRNQFTFNFGTLQVGNLTTGRTAVVTFTFLGFSAGDRDTFTVSGSAGHVVSGSPFTINPLGTTTIGSTITDTVQGNASGIGSLAFNFHDNHYSESAANGTSGNRNSSTAAYANEFGILDETTTHPGPYTIGGHTYSAVLMYNDGWPGDNDFNDMVVGVNSVCLPVSQVPEPRGYAMLLAGLGLIGFAIRRNKKNGVANFA